MVNNINDSPLLIIAMDELKSHNISETILVIIILKDRGPLTIFFVMMEVTMVILHILHITNIRIQNHMKKGKNYIHIFMYGNLNKLFDIQARPGITYLK